MKLKTNKNHNYAIMNKTDISKKFVISISGICITLSLFSGIGIKYSSLTNDKISSNSLDQDLNEITSLDLEIKNSSDIKKLNKCKNLKTLSLTINTSNLEDLKDINNLKKLESLSIKSNNEIVFNASNFKFLCSNNIKKLSLDGVTIDSSFFKEFTNLETLTIGECFFNSNIDFSVFSQLKELNINANTIYNNAMFINSILIDESIYVNKDLKKVCDNIDTILQRNCYYENVLNYSDREKFDVVLSIVLELLSYDRDFQEFKRNNTKEEIENKYYKNGYLYGVFNNANEVICGNYAALFTALANRVGLESYFINGIGHAFNLVKIENKFYYTDPTWLDCETYNESGQILSSLDMIRMGRGGELEWYLKDPNVYIDEEHIPQNIPNNIRIKKVKSKKGSVFNAFEIVGYNIFGVTISVPLLVLLVNIINKKRENIKILNKK